MTIAKLRKDLIEGGEVPPVIDITGLCYWSEFDWRNSIFDVIELNNEDEFNLWLFSERTGAFFGNSIDFEFEEAK